jgi:hypothetical protein
MNNSCEQYHCESGWLPVDGFLDTILLDDDEQIPDYLPLLIPTEYRCCFCSDSDNLPEGVEV